MKKRFKIICIITCITILLTILIMLAISLVTSRPFYDQQLSLHAMQNCNILDTNDALTFARYLKNGKKQLLLVKAYKDNRITGINVTQLDTHRLHDPVSYFNKYGYEAIRKQALNKKTVSIEVSQLILPADFNSKNIAVGLNYPTHAKEVKMKNEPFVFPKICPPTPFNSSIAINTFGLADYEIELGYVTLQEISKDTREIRYMGFILVNDFSDRWPLVTARLEEIFGSKKPGPAGIRGFPDAKNNTGSFPVGNMFIIPRDYKKLYSTIELQLYRNGHLRQKTDTGLMIWGPERCINEILKRSDLNFEYNNTLIKLLPEGETIKPGTVILSGTHHGVIFKKTNWWNPLLYLHPGEELFLKADGLGIIQNTIIK